MYMCLYGNIILKNAPNINNYQNDHYDPYALDSVNMNLDYFKPVRGNYAILDFTKFNLGHGIRAVGNNYRRFALQCFVGH